MDTGLFSGTKRSFFDISAECTQGGGRQPPKSPARFAKELKSKCFTAGLEDMPLVAGLYRDGFVEKFASTTELAFSRLGWGDDEMRGLMEIAEEGYFKEIEELDLSFNKFGDGAIRALAEIASKPGGLLGGLKRLDLSGNQYSLEGSASLAEAIAGGALPMCSWFGGMEHGPFANGFGQFGGGREVEGKSGWRSAVEVLRVSGRRYTSPLAGSPPACHRAQGLPSRWTTAAPTAANPSRRHCVSARSATASRFPDAFPCAGRLSGK